MKRTALLGYAILLLSNLSFAQLSLEVSIVEIRNNTGKIMLQLFDENEKVITQEMGEIKERKCSFSFEDLKPGKYALRYYHDENTNGKMETNLLGKPTEGFGFSNNVTDKYGPPPFQKWLFDLNGDAKLVLKPTY